MTGTGTVIVTIAGGAATRCRQRQYRQHQHGQHRDLRCDGADGDHQSGRWPGRPDRRFADQFHSGLQRGGDRLYDGDVTLTGTAGATTAVVTGSGTTYNVAVSGMTGSGTVIASMCMPVAQRCGRQHQYSPAPARTTRSPTKRPLRR